MKLFFKTYWTYFVSFIIPIIIMIGVYLSQGIYWNSDTSPLLGDGFHQYVIFDIALRNILHGNGSLFYTFTSGLGLNFYALSSYYLGSFLSPLVYFFDLTNMPDAVYLTTLLKFGLIGLSTYFSLNKLFQSIPNPLKLALSTSYALMSFTVSQLEIKTWLDVFILIPLIITGLQILITKKKFLLYFTSLSILFIQNYYFGYMTALFLIFWYLCQISWDFKTRKSSFLDFIITSVLAGMASLILTLPTLFDLQTHGEKLTEVTKFQTESSWYLDLFAKQFIGSFDTTKYGAIPMIFVGLLPFILTILFFTLKTIKFHVKLIYAIFFTFLIASFYIEALDLFWQGMHTPNMFLHRYAWIFSTLLIYTAAEVLNRLKEIKIWNFLVSLFLIVTGFLATIYLKSHYSFLTDLNILLTLEFLIVYSLLLLAVIKKFISVNLFAILISLFIMVEMSLNASSQMDGIAKEWGFASRSSYNRDIPAMESFSTDIGNQFTRTEKLQTQTGNDSMKFNYNGISQFSSVRNRSASSTLDKLGFKSSGTNLNLRYGNNSILADSLFGIQYNISDSPIDKYGFKDIYQKDNLTLYENQYSLPIAFASQSVYNDVKFNEHTLDNQASFLNQLANVNFDYFSPIPYEKTENTDDLISVTSSSNEDAAIQYQIEVPENSQIYLSFTNLHFSNDKQKKVDILVNGEKKTFTTDNVFSFFNLGYTKEKKTFNINVSFPGNSQVSFESPTFYRLDTQTLTEAIQKIKEQPVTVSTSKNKVFATYDVQQDTSIFFTIPYDKGWSAYQDGKKIEIKQTQTGFMKVDVPKGKGTITLSFIPNGFITGAICSFTSLLLFGIYNHRQKSSKT
ncbi:copper ABC transporter permease [Streptococcus sp. HMSC073F11]|uniref:Copper ABC transporter permease n=2 Tax=Streptococcus mitis TaxID=28037 RepID=S7XJM0_STRMT|nr:MULTISPECIES: YfhO family protein [Streptococcus]EPR94537.1 copper ABC transporter permease [Streptococcus mitis 18/56]EPR96628.1 copper ABC transporter permease [Streptococcus mitis 29/42]ETD97536.1 copper ABC transporter permease [Streptococcus mitis 27/7]MBT2175195.1 YfhO family protein [Streptococcus mitis]OFL53337.1 copper ABC transporter permease [Streptococcus sp. HMSC073F11]